MIREIINQNTFSLITCVALQGMDTMYDDLLEIQLCKFNPSYVRQVLVVIQVRSSVSHDLALEHFYITKGYVWIAYIVQILS